jgi:hypothetical protein
MQIGSAAHKELFVEAFFSAHRRYEASELAWPNLDSDPDALALLRSLPFWTHARQFESSAGPMILCLADRISDKLLREALELQAFEEQRHAAIVDHMIDLYDLPAEAYEVEPMSDPVAEFAQFGFEECLDSFGAFGLFKLARDSKLLPDGIFEIFENVMREEAQHIVFFINWFAYHQAQRGALGRLLRPPKSLWHYGQALWAVADLVGDDEGEEGADFIVTGAQAFVDELSPRLVLEACVSENERRMASFDRRLLVPRLVPALARGALAALELVARVRIRPAARASS